MQMITDVKIDMYGETQYYMASAKQGDKATRYLRIQLMNNGNEFQIPDDVTLIANIKKPDGKYCYNECTKQGNRVMVQLTNQALAAAGTAYCDIEMRDESGELILSSAAFAIEIEQSMRNESAIESSNEIKAFDKRLEEAKAFQQEVIKAKESVENTYQNYINALDIYYAQLTAYTDKAISDLINGAPETLDTLKEIADEITKNKTIVDALNAAIGKKANAAEFDSHVKQMSDLIGENDISEIGGGSVTGAISALNSSLNGLSFTVLTQAEYNALASKNVQTLYFIKEG